jgi:hypothetical protein
MMRLVSLVVHRDTYRLMRITRHVVGGYLELVESHFETLSRLTSISTMMYHWRTEQSLWHTMCQWLEDAGD